MNLYAESSAVLAWLLGEDTGRPMREALIGAETVVSSDLTLIECDRALHRATALRELTERAAAACKASLVRASLSWNILRISPRIVERSRQPFPEEPIRALDAIHVASVLFALQAFHELALLSLDERIRRVGRGLGFRILPE